MDSLDLKPIANFLYVAIPERYEAPKGPRSPDGLGITLLSGEDCMKELEAAIRTGSVMQIETESARSIKNLMRVGQVLQVPSRLDNTMTLCAGGPKGYRTFADITPTVEVGDTVFLDVSALIPDNDGSNPNEILPGIYRLPYSAVICTVFECNDLDMVDLNLGYEPLTIVPAGGYVLLSRVWADDVKLEFIDGELRKCFKDGDLITAVDVGPLPNEGIVSWVGEPLKGSLNEIHPGQRVVIAPGQALVETIAGESYLCVRQDYVLAIREPNEDLGAFLTWLEADLKTRRPTLDEYLEYLRNDLRNDHQRLASYINHKYGPEYLPLSHPSYDA